MTGDRRASAAHHRAAVGRVHIMGIAGSGMSALARILFDRGLPVSGCEARESITVAGLGGVGLRLVAGVRLPGLAAAVVTRMARQAAKHGINH